MNSKSLQSRLFNRTAAAGSVETHRYQRHEDCVDSSDGDSQTAAEGSSRQEDKYQRDIHFVFLPGKYEPLVDEEAKEEKKKRKKLKYKKVKKVCLTITDVPTWILFTNLTPQCVSYR